MAIVVLVLWLFTAGAGFFVLLTSNLGRARPAPAPRAARALVAQAAAPSKRELRRAARDRFDPPSLTAAKRAPVVPDLRSLLEFAHPGCAIAGLGFWLGYTFVHYRVLGWIGFGLVAATACLGLTWFSANTRAARRRIQGEPGPSFSGRLAVLHGAAATVTLVLAALSALVIRA